MSRKNEVNERAKLSKTQEALLRNSRKRAVGQVVSASASWGRGPEGGRWSIGTRETQAYLGLLKKGFVENLHEPKSTYSTHYYGANADNLAIHGVEFVGILTPKGLEMLTNLK